MAAPIEELRVPAPRTGAWHSGLSYHNKAEEPKLYLEMLLCGECQTKYHAWLKDGRVQRQALNHFVALIDLARYCHRYWKQRVQENRSVSLARREIPLGPEDSGTTPLPQNLC